MHSPSQALVDILLLNGLSETTKRNYPDHWARFQSNPYNPDTAKRSFRISNAHKVSLKFDYINMQLVCRNFLHGFILNSDEELKAMISFMKLNSTDREKLFRHFKKDGWSGIVMLMQDPDRRKCESSGLIERLIEQYLAVQLN